MSDDTGPQAKPWALAATAVLTIMTRRAPRHDLLGGTPKSPETEKTAKTILEDSWKVDSRETLLATLEELGAKGESENYKTAAAEFAGATPEQRTADPHLAFVGAHASEIGARGLLAWDLGRLIAVSGWGYLADFHHEEEAWAAILAAATRLRAAYQSWDEYGHHYHLGCVFWDPGAAAQVEEIIGKLTSDPESPWKTIPFQLGAEAPAAAGADAPAPVPAADALVAAPPAASPIATSRAPRSSLLIVLGALGVIVLLLVGWLGFRFLHHGPHEPQAHGHRR